MSYCNRVGLALPTLPRHAPDLLKLRPVDTTEAASTSKRSLLFFNRFERFQNQLVLTGATGACFKMLSHAVKHSLDRHSVENALSVLVQFIKAFRAGQLHFSRLSDHLQQPVNLFRV